MKYLVERIRKIADALFPRIYTDRTSIPVLLVREGTYLSPRQADDAAGEWTSFTPKDTWGGFDAHAWFRFDVEISEERAGKPVCLLFGTAPLAWDGWDATNPQFLVFVDGIARQGVDTNHQEVLLCEAAVPGTRYRVDVQAYGGRAISPGETLRLSVDVAGIDREMEALYWDLKVSVESLALLDEDLPARHALLEAVNAAINLLDWRNPEAVAFHDSVRAAREFIHKEVFNTLCGREEVVATSVGHTHIDVAWHWTVAQTREKVARSFATVLALMEQYPEYVFMSSQPQLYAFLKEDQPELYSRVKEQIANGRWEAEGGMWLEADCNVPSGESLVRQLLYGKAFFRNEFGIDNRILWLPDVFGYSAALPQILKKSGIDYFMTTKISWNQFNKLPYDTFTWKGIDGTEMLTYFITNTNTPQHNFTTYNGNTDPASVLGTWKRYQQKDINQDVLIAFGHGDGGGGPTRGMLESARRLSAGVPGIPRVRMGTSRAFFEGLEKKVAGHARLPRWVGELYLEYHRGTYTSMAANKRYNRLCEILWGEVEFLSVLAGRTGPDWPKEAMDAAWKNILLNQFHDILPGTSIREVYENCRVEYEALLAQGRKMVSDALERIAEPFGLVGTHDQAGAKLLVANTLGQARADLVSLPVPEGFGRPALNVSGARLAGQLVEEDGQPQVLFHVPHVPAKGFSVYPLVEMARTASDTQSEIPVGQDGQDSRHSMAAQDGEAAQGGNAAQDGNAAQNRNAALTVSAEVLENRFFRILLDDRAQLCSVYDKTAKREVLQKDCVGNALLAFEDRPMQYDNWDIDMYYSEKCWPVDDLQSVTVVESGPLRGVLRVVRRFSESVLTQDIRIYRDIPRVDFKTHVDWQQSQILLKVAFPVDVHTDRATYEIQFGHVERPTHWNTSWDWARFEVCGHRWADLSEAGYGVSLLNDCKYGYDIRDGVMRLTLLKSGIEPNPTTDRGEHVFTYALFPHQGDWREGGTLPMAASLNVPLKGMAISSSPVPPAKLAEAVHAIDTIHANDTVHAIDTPRVAPGESAATPADEPVHISFVSCDASHVVVETIKQAEDGRGFVVRLYEAENRRGPVVLTFSRKVSKARLCNLMEEDGDEAAAAGRKVSLAVKPLEIVTLRICFEAE